VSRNDDFRYFQRRARVERALAEQAESPCSRLAHLEMARSYEKRVDELTDPVNARPKMRWGTTI
jgi:hypothetical protein